MGAGICRALNFLFTEQKKTFVKSALVGVANFLFDGPVGNIHADLLHEKDFASPMITDSTQWGKVLRLKPAGGIAQKRGRWLIEVGPLGRREASFL
jgi:hypothetical protein